MRVKEAVIVEGRCDKAKLSSLIEGTIVETGGFAIFNDREKLELIRRLAERRGVIILTDSDGAGFLIRSKLSSCLPPEQVKHAYTPDVYGKERRKARPSKEGKLGVEGMDLPVLEECLRRAGATIEDAPAAKGHDGLTKADLYELGPAERRRALQKRLGLPERLSANGLLQALNSLYTKQELEKLLSLEGEDTP